mmetsp:Transcript_23154/g.46335  ORF Transcript_23154/g.46335 Transcript_23154/m.46335 type:complete len:202 (-) Transcript_23154:328-933(-)
MQTSPGSSSTSGEMEGWLKKKSPKTSGKKMMDVWQRRYFVLSGGELKYYKTEKTAHLSNADSLKSIRLEHVVAASVNPRHVDMFIIDLGLERKVKLQAGSERERDAWVSAIEAAKLKAYSAQEANAYSQVVQEARNASSSSGATNRGAARQPETPARPASPMSGSVRPSRESREEEANNTAEYHTELLRTAPRKQGCCVIS